MTKYKKVRFLFRRKTTLLLYALFIVFFFGGCTKLKVENDLIYSSEVSLKFFKLPANADIIVKRVASYLQNKNETNEFINDFVKKEGYAIWDKAIINNKMAASSFQSSNIAGGDTIVVIPLVIENTNLVNGYLEAILNGNTTVLNYRRADYANKPFGTLESSTDNAEKYQLFIMKLDKLVFGHNRFKIVDARLFANTSMPNGCDREITLEAVQQPTNLNELPICYDVCTSYYWLCAVCRQYYCPLSFFLGSTCELNCTEGASTGGGSPTGGSGNPNGGGTSGGNNPVNTNPGTTPIIIPPIDISNPCGVIDSLLKIPSYKQMLSKLRDSTELSYEIGFRFDNALSQTNFVSTAYTGAGNAVGSAVTIEIDSVADGVAHTHNSSLLTLPNASGEDIFKLAEYFKKNKMRNYRTFTFPIITNNSSYIIMVEDSTKFRSFINNVISGPDKLRDFNDKLYLKYLYGDLLLTVSENEVNFLKGLKEISTNGTGLAVFRGDSAMTKFNRIQLNVAGNAVMVAPCDE